jgi:hypothetical protein
MSENTWRPGDKAMILFGDGIRRAAELTRGFVWVSTDGSRVLFAEGGFSAEPRLRIAPTDGDPRPGEWRV